VFFSAEQDAVVRLVQAVVERAKPGGGQNLDPAKADDVGVPGDQGALSKGHDEHIGPLEMEELQFEEHPNPTQSEISEIRAYL